MKKAILPAICILLCTLCIVFVPTEADAAIYDDTVRLHILAPSDTKEDQQLKLEIRDMVLKNYGDLIGKCSCIEEAKVALAQRLPDIEVACRELILNTGYTYSVSVTLTEEWYDTREYHDFSLPSGSYASLKIVLGEGEGQNWWCVMYPPMCLDVALSDTDCAENAGGSVGDKNEHEIYSEEESKLISRNDYKIKFKLLEVASLIFDKTGK